MAIPVCDCNVGLRNSGTPDCILIEDITYSIIVTPTFDSSGNRNFIDTTGTIDSTYITDRINAGRSGATITDKKQRWYPLPAMKNVEDVRGDDESESYNDGSTSFIQEGIRTFQAWMIKQSPTLKKKLDSWKCSEISAYVVDNQGNLIGNGEEAGKLYPLQLNNETWSPKYVKKVDGAQSKLQLNYSYARIEYDGDLKTLLASDTGSDMRRLKGLLDVNAAISSITTTGFTATLTLDYGDAKNPKKVEGLLLADFDLNETSPTPGAIVITSVTESSAGVYDFVIPAQTATDVLALDLKKDGFEMVTTSITIQ